MLGFVEPLTVDGLTNPASEGAIGLVGVGGAIEEVKSPAEALRGSEESGFAVRSV